MLTDYTMYCPICAAKQSMKIGIKANCANPMCNAHLTLQEQVHDGGFQITVGFK